uniref:Nonribosomal peptide synthetase n=3 Tax=Chromobacterium vaccinii TaxID=1108595 RepID=A0A7S9XF80_9NEIS|nr:nonribosomal peptide synthetase [Chromobacterium vaccinii]UTQ11566.1 NRPS [Chromobacterium vaccinii]
MNPKKIEAAYPLSPLQKGFLFHAGYDLQSADSYVAQLFLDFEGELDGAAMRSAADALMRRHANLRAGFVHPGGQEPVQVVLREVAAGWEERDWRGRNPQEAAEAQSAWQEADRERRFELSQPPLLRFGWLRLPAGRSQLVVTYHHILLDGWSLPLLLEELLALYRAGGGDGGLPEATPYSAYLGWLQERDRAAACEAWGGYLEGLEGPTLLAQEGQADKGAAAAQARLSLELPAELTQALTRQARQQGVTLNTLLQAAWGMLLGKLNLSRDVVFGITVAGRPGELPGVERMIGLFINTVPVRLRWSAGETVAGLVGRLQREQAGLLDHQHLDLVEIQRLAGQRQLFDTLFIFENYPFDSQAMAPDLGQASLRRVSGGEQHESHYPLTLMAVPREMLSLYLSYDAQRFDKGVVQGLLTRFRLLLEAVAAEPSRPVSDIELLDEAERRQVLIEWNATERPSPQATLPELFEAQAARAPNAAALFCDGETLDYAELNRRANQLAHWLIGQGVGPEQRVALALPRRAELLVAVLGVLKSGAAYLPLDPAYPAERLAHMLADARPACLLGLGDGIEALPDSGVACWRLDDAALRQTLAAQPQSDPTPAQRRLRPEHPAYVIYTSGSSGQPKGVVISQRSAADFVDWALASFGAETFADVLATTSLSFDVSVFELLTPLLSGGRVRLLRDLLELGERPISGGSLISAVPSVFAQLLQHGAVSLEAKTVVFAGEALPPELVAAVRQRWPECRVANIYGPTETTVYAIGGWLEAGERAPTIGRPLGNTQTYVLDAGLRPAPVGVAGELYIAGAGLARGYLNRPGLTAERFVANPYGEGERLYRSGDLARWTEEGELEYLGRADQQLKVRGFRIEPGEIEAALCRHPSVAQAAVIAREDTPGHKQLVGYVVLNAAAADAQALRRFLADQLPEHMVPAAMIGLDVLPLTPSGKLDRKALPAPDFAGRSGRAARDAQEDVLCGLFAETLGLPQVSIDDSFFDLGGDSLLATRLISRIRVTQRRELSIRTLFECPTVAALARQLSGDGELRPPLRRLPRPQTLPLSYAQQRLWFIHHLEGPSPTYNIPVALRLSGALETDVLEAALLDVVRRHESLRTVYVQSADDTPLQCVLSVEQLDDCRLIVHEPLGETRLGAVLSEASRHCFDLSCELPLRAELFPLDSGQQVLLLLLHHIAGDGGSLPVLADDLAAAYEARCQGREPAWRPLPVQYADYTLWQRQLLGNERDPDSLIGRQFAYWKQALAGLPDQLCLPTDRPRPAMASYQGDYCEFRLDAETLKQLKTLARRHGATLSMALQAALAALLSRLGAGDDIPLGCPIAGRTDDALANLVGFFVNTWVLRVDTSGRPDFATLLGRVRQQALAAYSHQDVPFERLVELLNPARSASHHPLFQVNLALQNNIFPLFRFSGREVSLETVGNRTAKFDLFFNLFEMPSDEPQTQYLQGYVEYATELFDRATVERLLTRFRLLLEAVAAEPSRPMSDIELLDEAERRQVLIEWNATERPSPQATLPELFEAQAARAPNAAALFCDGETLDYAELNRRANQLAHWLIGQGVGPEQRVALALPRRAELLVAVLGVLKSGAAYLPLDPAYPAERLAHMLADARPACLLGLGDGIEALPDSGVACWRLDDAALRQTLAAQPQSDPTPAQRRLRPEHPAYVIYTSGSSGQPKGVVISQRSAADFVDWALASFGAETFADVLATTSLSFDVSVFELLTPLLSGGRVRLLRDLLELGERPISGGSLISAVPSVFAQLLQHGAVSLEAKTVVFAGEALPPELVAAVRQRWPECRVANIYGPTETTVYAIGGWLEAGERAPTIGRPLGNTQTYVLDAGLRPAPVGVAGELYIAGAGLARGYLNRPGLTAERFVANPYGEGERLYRSGDLARWTEEGELEYLGRADQQLKVRGFRIEPGEIEAALCRHPSVAQAAVIAREDTPGHKQLVGYVVLDDAAALQRDEDSESRQVEAWQQVYDTLYDAHQHQPFGENFGGWDSSYDGQPLPLAQMREWRSATVERIRELRPRRLLEIGVGSGLLLAPLADACEAYWGTDLSPATIAVLEKQLETQSCRDKVRLFALGAHELARLPAMRFDCIVINSVLQYFPNAAYLGEVIEQALARLEAGGALYLGDVRNLELLPSFAAAVELRQSEPEVDAAALQRRVSQRLLAEKELLLAPDFFSRLREQLPQIGAVDIRLKRGEAANELNRYRYEVVLRKGPCQARSLASAAAEPWSSLGSLSACRERLSVGGDALRVTGVPNALLHGEAAAARELKAGGSPSALLARLDENGGVRPEALRRLGAELGWRMLATWSRQAGHFDAVFVRGEDGEALDGVYQPAGALQPLSGYVNNPANFEQYAAIRRYALEQLPEYMVPAAIVLLDALPLTPNGKLDRRALPAPEFGGTGYRAPESEREQLLARLFGEVLGLPQVGADDSFFDLGGDSIISIQLVSRARKAGWRLTPRDVFQQPTVAALAQAITPLDAAAAPPSSAAQVALNQKELNYLGALYES